MCELCTFSQIRSHIYYTIVYHCNNVTMYQYVYILVYTILYHCNNVQVCIYILVYVTIFGKIDHLRASTKIHFLPVQERYIHALSRNTNCLTIDGQVCFYRQLFTDAVKPRGCILWSWGALIGLHGVPNCSSQQSWLPLWILSVHVTY